MAVSMIIQVYKIGKTTFHRNLVFLKVKGGAITPII